jgi:hypothetical protein
MEVSGQLHDTAALPPGKEPLDRTLGVPQNRSGGGGEDKNMSPAGHPVSLLTELKGKDKFVPDLN